MHQPRLLKILGRKIEKTDFKSTAYIDSDVYVGDENTGHPNELEIERRANRRYY